MPVTGGFIPKAIAVSPASPDVTVSLALPGASSWAPSALESFLCFGFPGNKNVHFVWEK